MEDDKAHYIFMQGAKSGACAASVLVKNGELYAANVGDCRVVLSRKGLATSLTNDHNLSREDERSRIENSVSTSNNNTISSRTRINYNLSYGFLNFYYLKNACLLIMCIK